MTSAARLRADRDFTGVLMLADAGGGKGLDRVKRAVAGGEAPGWTVDPTQEEQSCRVQSSRGTLFVVAGQQIRTEESLEVLALGTTKRYSDRRPLEETLDAVLADGSLAIIPWGFGKWLRSRGEAVRRALELHVASDLAVGDNGQRPRGWRTPRLIQRARELGVAVLPGSDPLPFGEQVRRVASYGFVLNEWPSTARPAAQIQALIKRLRSQPPVYGVRADLAGFLRAQVKLQLVRGRKV